MSMPLSPRSLESLNRANASPNKTIHSISDVMTSKKSPTGSCDTSSSSPFQTEVSGAIPAGSSPVKNMNTSIDQGNGTFADGHIRRGVPFDIHVDEDQDTIKLEPLTSSRPSVSTDQFRSSTTSLSDDITTLKGVGDDTLSCMREEIFTTTPMEKSSPNPDPDQENDEDYDSRSIVSDDTCFSQFSAVPQADMTLFANLRLEKGDDTIRSPTRRELKTSQTPSSGKFYTPGTSRRKHGQPNSRTPSRSPTPRQRSSGDTTNLLLDFTQQFRSPSRRGLSPTKTEPNLLSHIKNQRIPSPSKETPAGKRNLMTLLDFDLPPQPTPRSVPSITVRELESLKSTYLSEISSLKATLSGKEAEVESLKKAVTDAERRVGEALENLREEKSAKEDADKQRVEWEKKGQEVECILRNVREEFVFAEREKEELLQKLEESTRLREEAELKAATATSKATIAQNQAPDSATGPNTDDTSLEDTVEQRVSQQLDERMENLARELHAVYKKKHESKVATLKKTYEARSDKKCRDLQEKIAELAKQNDELQANKDASFPGEFLDDVSNAANSEQLQQIERQNTELEETKAKLAGLSEEIKSVKSSHAQLLQDLENERIEKGELVAAVDEMLALQAEVGAPNAVEDFRKSIGRPQSSNRPQSGIRGPGFGTASASGLPGPAVSGSGKSKMMMGIERMGKH